MRQAMYDNRVEGASFFERMARLCNESYYFCDEELEAFRRSLQIEMRSR
ncbi:MAG: hypothetical protein ACLR23_18175 [Clostridia bacterium]